MGTTKGSEIRVNKTHVVGGVDEDGMFRVRAGRMGTFYKVLPANPPEADRIKTIRIGTGLSEEDFAKALGISVNTLRNWEKGISEPEGLYCRFLDVLEKDVSRIEQFVKREIG